MQKYGPLKDVKNAHTFCFVYEEKYKHLSHDLYFSLIGKKYATFSGLENMFNVILNKNNVKGISLNSFNDDDLKNLINQIVEISKCSNVMVFLLFPFNKDNKDGAETYFKLKHLFLDQNIPVQFVSVPKASEKNGLKWSVSNIALASFCKLGGTPWKVQPKNNDCLIIGIGQAHRKLNGIISRYFSYSVLTDSSGIYDSMRILACENSEDVYLNGITSEIKKIIIDFSSKYKKFVIHTPFKLKKRVLLQTVWVGIRFFPEKHPGL